MGTAMELVRDAVSQIEKIDGVYLFDGGRGVICGEVFGSAEMWMGPMV